MGILKPLLIRTGFFAALAAAAAFCAPSQPAYAVDEAAEYEVKAAFVYQFAKFIEWPSEAFEGKTFCIGIIGADPFGGALDSLAGEEIDGRPIEIRRLSSPVEARGCHMVFVSASESRRTKEIFRHLRGQPVVTIGDMDGFAERGGIIGFRMQDKKVRFDINAARAQVSGIRISSKLLKLAGSIQ